MLVPLHVSVPLGVDPSLLAAPLACLIESLLVGPAVLGGISQAIRHVALLYRLQKGKNYYYFR